MASAFDRPMTAGPRDVQVGVDELGRPVYRTVLGRSYAEGVQPRDNASGRALMAAAQAGRPFTPGYDDRRGPGFGEAVGGLLGAAAQGATAPGRALLGEDVTLGDVWSTALDFGAGGLLGSAPKGAVRAGAMRGYHGSGAKNIEEFRVKRSPRGDIWAPAFVAVDEPGTDALSYANSYNFDRRTGKEMAGRTYEVEIPENPKILDARIPEERARLIAALDADDSIGEGGEMFLEMQSQRGSQLPGWGDDRLYRALDRAGYEGVVLQERPADPSGRGGVISAAVFDPRAARILNSRGLLSE